MTSSVGWFLTNLTCRPYSLDESIPNLEQGPKDELQVAHAQVLDYLREHMTVSCSVFLITSIYT